MVFINIAANLFCTAFGFAPGRRLPGAGGRAGGGRAGREPEERSRAGGVRPEGEPRRRLVGSHAESRAGGWWESHAESQAGGWWGRLMGLYPPLKVYIWDDEGVRLAEIFFRFLGRPGCVGWLNLRAYVIEFKQVDREGDGNLFVHCFGWWECRGRRIKFFNAECQCIG